MCSCCAFIYLKPDLFGTVSEYKCAESAVTVLVWQVDKLDGKDGQTGSFVMEVRCTDSTPMSCFDLDRPSYVGPDNMLMCRCTPIGRRLVLHA